MKKTVLPGYFCSLFIGPEFDHWLPLSLTNSCLVDLIDLTLACEDANSKLADLVTLTDVDDEDHVGNSLLRIWELSLNFCSDFELKVG